MTFAQQTPLPLRLDPDLSFAQFYRGENGEVVEHLMRAARLGRPQQIFLHAASGRGKSHLLQAAVKEASMTGRCGIAVALNKVFELGPEVLEGLEQLDLIALDDIERVCGHPDWEARLFTLFNALESGQKTLILAADAPPDQLDVRLLDLRSRFQSTLILRVKPLSDAQTRAALCLRAKAMGLDLRPAVADYLMKHLPRDIQSLVGFLDQVDPASLAAQRRLTIPFIRAFLGSAAATADDAP